ncbi:MAG: hypothetical protein JST26_09120 [Bacteroidetes bacterium]|nr:hypothetical protein [Bacteroidota bacterium]
MIKPLVICFHSVILFIFGFFFGDGPGSLTGNFPKNAKPGTEFAAEILIKKGSVGGFAKLQIEVPQGFTIKESDSKGANFTFENNMAKYIWTSAPSDPEFTVKFTVALDASASGTKTIAAKYSFVNNNAKEVIEMSPVEIVVGEGGEPVAATTTPTTATEPVTTTTPVENTTPVTTSPTTTPSSFETPAEPASNVACIRTITDGANAGEYNIEVKIKKPGIKGFAKYQDLIPEGYTAKAGTKNSGSSFSVADGKAKFVWVSLPAEDEMVVNYILEKSPTASPDAKLEGEFSYLENDQTKKIKIPGTFISSNSAVASNNTKTVPTETTTTEKQADNNTATNTNTTAAVADNNTPVKTETTSPISKKEGNVSYCVQIGAFRNAIGSEVLARKFNVSANIRSEMAEGFNKFMVGNFNEYKGARDHREEMKQKGCASAFVAAYNGPKRITVQEALMITSQKWYK